MASATRNGAGKGRHRYTRAKLAVDDHFENRDDQQPSLDAQVTRIASVSDAVYDWLSNIKNDGRDSASTEELIRASNKCHLLGYRLLERRQQSTHETPATDTRNSQAPADLMRKRKREASTDSSLLDCPNRKSSHFMDTTIQSPCQSNSLFVRREICIDKNEPESKSKNSVKKSIGKHEKTYEKRPRHKTREDHYEPTDNAKALKNPKPKRRKRKGKRERPSTNQDLLGDFSSRSIGQERLTVRPTNGVGIYINGRASSPARRRGLPDLSFSEMTFLEHAKHSKSLEQEEKPTSRSQKKEKSRYLDHKEVSAYFAKPMTSLEIQTPQVEAKASLQPLRDSQRKLDNHTILYQPSKDITEDGEVSVTWSTSSIVERSIDHMKKTYPISSSTKNHETVREHVAQLSNSLTRETFSKSPTPESIRRAIHKTRIFSGTRLEEQASTAKITNKNVEALLRAHVAQDRNERDTGIGQPAIGPNNRFHGAPRGENTTLANESIESRGQQGKDTVSSTRCLNCQGVKLCEGQEVVTSAWIKAPVNHDKCEITQHEESSHLQIDLPTVTAVEHTDETTGSPMTRKEAAINLRIKLPHPVKAKQRPLEGQNEPRIVSKEARRMSTAPSIYQDEHYPSTDAPLITHTTTDEAKSQHIGEQYCNKRSADNDISISEGRRVIISPVFENREGIYTNLPPRNPSLIGGVTQEKVYSASYQDFFGVAHRNYMSFDYRGDMRASPLAPKRYELEYTDQIQQDGNREQDHHSKYTISAERTELHQNSELEPFQSVDDETWLVAEPDDDIRVTGGSNNPFERDLLDYYTNETISDGVMISHRQQREIVDEMILDDYDGYFSRIEMRPEVLEVQPIHQVSFADETHRHTDNYSFYLDDEREALRPDFWRPQWH